MIAESLPDPSGAGLSAQSERAPLRILVVEDSENDYLLVLGLLRRDGFVPEARRVETERQLRDALEEVEWEVVIADYNLPLFNAPAALEVVRHYCPDTPFIIVAGNLQEDMAALAIRSGADDALNKESLVRLPAVIRRELKTARTRAAQRQALDAAAESREALKDSESRFLLLTQHLPECFWLYDVASRRIVYVNDAYSRITGRPVDAFYQNPRDIIDAMQRADAVRLGDAMKRARFGGVDDEYRIHHWDGSLRWVHLRTFPVRDEKGIVRSVGGVMSDITAMVNQQNELQRMAHFDALTGLPNRILFKERLSASLSMAKRNHWQLGLLFVDLDRFKIINDTLGHAVGDELLQHAAKRMRMVVRESDTVSRMGGDEFAVIVPDLPSADDAASVARKLIDALEQPFQLAGQDLYVSASIGIALFPEDTGDPDTLIRNADAAMYRAKETGRKTYEFYRAEMNQRARELLSLELDLRQALARREFELHYQPKVNLTSGSMSGVEALIRWRNPQRGLVSPIDFIPLLEETGMIVAVGDWVMQEACRQMMVWHDAGYRHMTVAVNLSARQVTDGGLVKAVRAALDNSGLPATALELELTESMLMRDAPAVESLLDELRQMGVALSVDDFGTGYSSLAYLKRFPLDTLKIDRSFVRDITADPDDASITRAVIQMAHELSLKVVAEGVETAAQLQLLAGCSCDEIQGFYYSRPLPPAALADLLIEQRVIDDSLLRHRSDRARIVLLGDGADEQLDALVRQLETGGALVHRVSSDEQARLWLVDHGCDVLVGRLCNASASDPFAVFADSVTDPRRGIVLLAGEREWEALRLGAGGGSISFDAVLHWPGEIGAVALAIESVLVRRRLQSENQRLIERNRKLENQATSVLAGTPEPGYQRVATVSASGAGGLGAWLERSLDETGVGLIGIDAEGMVVSANQVSEELFPQGAGLIGSDACDVLPAVFRSLDGALSLPLQPRVALVGGRWWQFSAMPFGAAEGAVESGAGQTSVGWLLLLAPAKIDVDIDDDPEHATP